MCCIAENLIRSMVNGRKHVTASIRGSQQVSPWRVVPVLILLAVLGAWLALGTHAPPP